MDRIAAARARLDEAASVARKAKEAGPPCSECHFKTLLDMCGHPAYAEPSFDPVSHTYSERFVVPVRTARSEEGLCGSEAVLFEPHGTLVPLFRGFLTGAKVAWVGLLFGIIALVALWR